MSLVFPNSIRESLFCGVFQLFTGYLRWILGRRVTTSIIVLFPAGPSTKKTITRMTASCCQNQFGVSKPTRLEGDLFYVRYNSVIIKCPFKHFLSKVELNYLGQYDNTMVTFKPYLAKIKVIFITKKPQQVCVCD